MTFVLFALLSAFQIHAQTATTTATTPSPTPPPGLHHESELGYIVVGGNAKSQSFSGKQATWYQFENDLLKLSAHYLSSKAQDQTTKEMQGTAENWSTIGRFEHVFIPKQLNGYLQAGVSGDRFIGVTLGQAYDVGAKHFWVAKEHLTFFSELGYRYLHEDLEKNNIKSELESHFIRVFSQIDYAYTESIKVGLWAEYLPNLKDNENYRISFSPYLLAILSDTFSLKFGYEGYYRNIPVAPNTIRMDYRHVTALIAKF